MAMSAVLIIFLLLGYNSPESSSGDDDLYEDGEVRLVGGPNDFEGRVEVYLGGVWRRWCRSSPGLVDTEATVVCRQLGHGTGAGVLDTAFYGVGNSSEFISSVSCPADAVGIINCTYDTTTVIGDCNDVAVFCQDTSCTGTPEEPMLTTNTEGLVELCDGNFISGLCYEDFTMETATVLCRQQGLNACNPGFVEVQDIHYFRTYSSYSCTGNEQQFGECTLSSVRTSVVCSSVRLNCTAHNVITDLPAITTTHAVATNFNTTTTTAVLTGTSSEAILTVVVGILAAVVVLMLIIGIISFVIFYVKCWRYKQELSRLRGEREHYFATTNEAYDIVVPTEGNVAYNTRPNTIPNGEYANVLLYDTIPNYVPTGTSPNPTEST